MLMNPSFYILQILLLKNNNDKAQKDFNHDTYDITASDSAYVPAEVTTVVDKDTADKYLAFAELL